MNHCIVSNLPDPQDSATHLYSADSVGDDDDPTMYPTETLNSLDISGMPPHDLSEKPRGYHDVAKS